MTINHLGAQCIGTHGGKLEERGAQMVPSLGHKLVRAETGEEACLLGTVCGTAGQEAVTGDSHATGDQGWRFHLLPCAPDHTHAPRAPATHEHGDT